MEHCIYSVSNVYPKQYYSWPLIDLFTHKHTLIIASYRARHLISRGRMGFSV